MNHKGLSRDPKIRAGLCAAKATTKKHARTFYFASQFLPPEKKQAAYTVYSICRISDDVVDNQSLDSLGQLNSMKEKIAACYSQGRLNNELLLAFREIIQAYQIPQHYFTQLLTGIEMDLSKERYQNFTELYDYSYKVAGVVGLIMLKIFGYQNQQAEKHAVELGIAMQLTNILRDIKEDWQRQRLYLPQDELRRFGVSEQNINQTKIDQNFIALLKYQIKRAREYYLRSESGISLISDRRSRFVVLAMKDIYAGILSSIEQLNYDVFSQRAHVNIMGKLKLSLRIILQGRYL
ncbi:phytoene/squalene synthase family protein [Candidatus Omnitrophota bacterium]